MTRDDQTQSGNHSLNSNGVETMHPVPTCFQALHETFQDNLAMQLSKPLHFLSKRNQF